MEFLRRILLRLDLNIRTSGLLLKPFFPRIQPNNNSKWSWDILYVKMNRNGLTARVNNRSAIFSILRAQTVKPMRNFFLPCCKRLLPSVVVSPEHWKKYIIKYYTSLEYLYPALAYFSIHDQERELNCFSKKLYLFFDFLILKWNRIQNPKSESKMPKMFRFEKKSIFLVKLLIRSYPQYT